MDKIRHRASGTGRRAWAFLSPVHVFADNLCYQSATVPVALEGVLGPGSRLFMSSQDQYTLLQRNAFIVHVFHFGLSSRDNFFSSQWHVLLSAKYFLLWKNLWSFEIGPKSFFPGGSQWVAQKRYGTCVFSFFHVLKSMLTEIWILKGLRKSSWHSFWAKYVLLSHSLQ